MKWNSEKGAVLYQTSYNNIKNILGISDLDLKISPEIAPYTTYILYHLNKKLLSLSVLPDINIESYINEITNIFDYGCTNIINGEINSLLSELGINTDEDGEVNYNQDRFILSWTNFYTSLIIRLNFQYYSILNAPVYNKCPLAGCDTEDLENWVSGFPELDKEYDGYYYGKNKNIIERNRININDINPDCINKYR